MSTPFVLKRTTLDSHVARMGGIPTPVLLLADEVATKAAAPGHNAMG